MKADTRVVSSPFFSWRLIASEKRATDDVANWRISALLPTNPETAKLFSIFFILNWFLKWNLIFTCNQEQGCIYVDKPWKSCWILFFACQKRKILCYFIGKSANDHTRCPGIAAARYLCIGKTSGFRNRQFRERASQTTSFWSRVNNCIPVINIMMLLITISR